jgi:hypothetical protein
MPAGRPSKYREDFPRRAFKLCLLGATDAQLADFFEVHIDTIEEWKKVHPEFSEALKAGKEEADSKVAKSLYRRALGYSHKAVKIVADAKTGTEHIVPYTEHYPPDTTACIFWLKNRQPRQWRDRVEHAMTKNDVREFSDEELRAMIPAPAPPVDGEETVH